MLFWNGKNISNTFGFTFVIYSMVNLILWKCKKYLSKRLKKLPRVNIAVFHIKIKLCLALTIYNLIFKCIFECAWFDYPKLIFRSRPKFLVGWLGMQILKFTAQHLRVEVMHLYCLFFKGARCNDLNWNLWAVE